MVKVSRRYFDPKFSFTLNFNSSIIWGMKINLALKLDKQTSTVVIPVFEKQKPKFQSELVTQFLKDNPDFGKPNQTQLLYESKQKILLVGVGKSDKFNFESAQNFGGTLVRSLLNKTESASILIESLVANVVMNELVEAVVLGADLANHDPSKLFKSERDKSKLLSLTIICSPTDANKKALIKARIMAEAINDAKMLGDMPPNLMTPTYFLNQAKKLAKEHKLKIKVIDEKQAKLKGMGAFIGVAQGSEEPSYIIAIEYQGNPKSKEKWGLVGKGITLDTGGISIKPAGGIPEMKYDMMGAATVLATVEAAARLKLKANIVGVMCLTENMPGGRAQRPGDIVKTYSGKTAEILNTDAEGRLVLVDGLSLAQKDYKATKLIDLATLTGAIVVALGDFYTGVFGNDPKFTQQLISTGAAVGEKYWELPMSEEYNEMIKGEWADISNIGHGGSMPGAAGAITGAKFIESVIEKNTPWIHLDIAGTAWETKSKPYRGAGATGVGVKTLVKLISEADKR